MAGLARTEQQLRSLGVLVNLVLSFLGGAWMPSFLMPGWMQSVSLFLPTHWVTEGLAAMTWRALPMEAGLYPASIVAAFGLVFGLIGLRTFRWH